MTLPIARTAEKIIPKESTFNYESNYATINYEWKLNGYESQM